MPGLSLVAMPAVLGMLSIFSVLHFPSLFPFPLFLLRAGFKTLVMDVSLFEHSVGQQDLASQILILSIAAAWKNVVHFFEDSEVVAIRMRPASRGREVHCFQYTAFRPRPDGNLLCVLAAGLTSVQVGWRHRHAQVRDHRVSFTPVSLKCLPCVPEKHQAGPVGWWKCYTIKCTINCNHVSFAMFRLFVILVILSSA